MKPSNSKSNRVTVEAHPSKTRIGRADYLSVIICLIRAGQANAGITSKPLDSLELQSVSSDTEDFLKAAS